MKTSAERFYSLACANMSKIVLSEEGRVMSEEFTCSTFRNLLKGGEYRGRTDDLLHAMQAL